MQSAPTPDWEAIAEQQVLRLRFESALVQRDMREAAREKAKRSAGDKAA